MFEIEQASRGGASLFQPFHILKSLWYLYITTIISRKDLSRKIGIGEGSTRKLLAHLESNECISTSRQGIILSKYGSEVIEALGLLASEIEAGQLSVGDKDFGLKLSNLTDKVKHGVEQRDEAVKVGAKGATTLLYYRDELRLPDGFDVEGAEPDISGKLKETFNFIEGDVLFIGTADTLTEAEDGAFAAAVWTIRNGS
jgi:hypothetical protein